MLELIEVLLREEYGAIGFVDCETECMITSRHTLGMTLTFLIYLKLALLSLKTLTGILTYLKLSIHELV